MQRFVEGKDGIRRSMLEYIDIQEIQDSFCKMSDIFMFAIDCEGNQLTEISGKALEVEEIMNTLGKDVFLSLAKRVLDSPIEDLLVEDTEYSNLKIAAIAVKNNGKPIMCWLACCVFRDTDVFGSGRMYTGVRATISRQKFYRALDTIVLVSNQLSGVANYLADVKAQTTKSMNYTSELSHSLARSEAMTSIVHLLGSDDSFEDLASRILEITGEFLGVSGTQLVQLKGENTMDVIKEWYADATLPVLGMVKREKCPAIYYSDKSIVVSGDSLVSDPVKDFMREKKLKAYIAMPLMIKDQVAMYLSVTESRQDKNWQIEEVKFVNDVAKILQSILDRRIQKNSLTSSFISLQAILDNVGTCIYVRDASSGKVLFMNQILAKTFEFELANDTLNELLDKARPLGVKDGYYEIHHNIKNRWYDMYFTYITWVDGKKASLCALYDITDKKLYQKRIEQQAYTDFLTGLYNRMCCERDLAACVDHAKNQGGQGGLLYLDLDDFKHINDGLGHQYGDVLLKSISNSLKQIEGINNSCYRMGGDEFVIIVPPESFSQFDDIVEQIRNVFSRPWFLKDSDYYCTMSMGICVFPEHGADVQELIKKADIAMYEAKKSGKNRVCRYSGDKSVMAGKRLDMEKNMRDASKGNCKEFEVYFQPISDIQKPGTPCVGAEALIRWNSAALGFISPADFIPLAEYLGLINPIGNHVLRQACIACKSWNDKGHPNYKVNVNLSVVQLLQNDIVAQIKDVIKETGINPHNLTLEVTESLAINDMERMKTILESIKSTGARIALDDFGTGYSSLNHIREIPLDVIKVDQSFVTDLAEDEYSQSFIKMVSELACAIDVDICVEGIEREEQYKVLEGMKVRMVQGYYFDRPMRQEDFERKYVDKQ